MKRIILALALCALVSSCRCNGGASADLQKDSPGVAADTVAVVDSTVADTLKVRPALAQQLASLPEEPILDMVTSLGTMTIKLYSGTPRHRANFCKLALSGYYDRTQFHRVISGFMIQGGDPLSKDDANIDLWGTGGPDYTIPAEFVPQYTHKKGAIAAARTSDTANPMKESSGSQFYIVQDEEGCRHLDGEYTVFGEVIEGLDVVDAISAVETDYLDRPIVPVKLITIRISEKL